MLRSIIFMTSSQKFTSQLLGKCLQFLVYALLFDINQTSYNKECFVSKHPLVTKIKLWRAEKSMLPHSIRLQCPSQTCWFWLTFFISRKISWWQCCCSCYNIGGIEAKALEWVFWGLWRSLRLAKAFGDVLVSICCAGGYQWCCK